MKLTHKFVSIFFAVLVIAAFAVVPAFARGENPPVDSMVFDWVAISNALQTLLMAFLLPAAGFLARWLNAKGSVVKTQLTSEQEYMINNAFRIFVYAAQQMHAKEYIFDKLEYATVRAEAWLIDNNIFMDLHEVRARIEAIVYQEFTRYALSALPAELTPVTPTE